MSLSVNHVPTFHKLLGLFVVIVQLSLHRYHIFHLNDIIYQAMLLFEGLPNL